MLTMTQTPSSGEGATPTAGTPATGTPSGGATPPKIATTLEEALSRIAELERHASNKAEEAARHGKNLTAAEKELAAYKEKERLAQEAQMTEVERYKKQQAEQQEQLESIAAELYQARVYQEVGRLASKFNFLVSSDTLAKMLLIDDDAIEFEDGKPTNIEKLLERLAKAEPDLVRKEQQQQAPQLPGMNPGRSTITQPGQTPGKVPSLFDPNLWKR
jgi:hypothetical protein